MLDAEGGEGGWGERNYLEIVGGFPVEVCKNISFECFGRHGLCWRRYDFVWEIGRVARLGESGNGVSGIGVNSESADHKNPNPCRAFLN